MLYLGGGGITTGLMYITFSSDVNEPPTAIYLSNMSVAESGSSTIFIASLSAEDPDRTNQTFTYSVLSHSFLIGGAHRDKLYYRGPLDFERTPSITVHLRVTDDGGLHFDHKFEITVLGWFGTCN